MAMRSWSVAAMTVAAIVATNASRARADASDHALVVIVVVGDGAAEVAARVEGQVSDLDVTLLRIDDTAWSAGAHRDPLAAATRLATTRDARVVVWFEADDASWTVHVAEPAAGRVLSRRVESAGDLASSASAEAVALVVRAALSAIADGGTIGVAPPPVEVAPPPPSIRREAPATRRHTYAALGWTGVAGGAGPRIQHGVVARLGLVTRRWRAGVALGVHPPVAVEQPGATMELSRTALGGFAARDLLGDGHAAWLLSLELGASATRFARVTTGADAPLSATPAAAIWAPTLAPTLRLSRRLGGGARLELSAGADLLLRVPEFGLGASGGFMTYARVNPVQPQAAVSVVVETR